VFLQGKKAIGGVVIGRRWMKIYDCYVMRWIEAVDDEEMTERRVVGVCEKSGRRVSPLYETGVGGRYVR
jgi:hypothetical protein